VDILKLWAKRIKTKYWKPGTDYLSEIEKATQKYVQEGDIIVLSEKAISTANGLLIDESNIKPSSLARFLVVFWTRTLWGGPLGWIVKFKDKTLKNLENYPIEEGASHKQVALHEAGFLQSLRHYSEGGIDASNLPYSYVCLPLPKPTEICEEIRKSFRDHLNMDVTVMIVDGDTTYSWRNLHLAPRKVNVPGLVHKGGFLTFLVGRSLGFRARQTPVSITGDSINPDRALWLANHFHRICGAGAGRTVWSMIENLNTGLTGVTWEMLESVDHYPIAIFRFD
jgi:F420-0:gamma-glutamyl ligase-like protein